MVYAKDDPRSALSTAVSSGGTSDADIATTEYLEFPLFSPTVVTDGGSREWVSRGQNFVLIHVLPQAGDVIFDDTLQGELTILLINDDSAISGRSVDGADSAVHTVQGDAFIVAPPGHTEITATGEGQIALLMAADEEQWASRAINAASYAQPHGRVAPLELWPEPTKGFQWYIYEGKDVVATPGRNGRIWRSRGIMVNFGRGSHGPRDFGKMSPHFHDDFEQASLVPHGDYVHHIQYPWGTDGNKWHAEEHGRVTSPSLTIITPPTIHTSEALDAGHNQLIDIFSPPRMDFSQQPGWVLNADDYPMPEK